MIFQVAISYFKVRILGKGSIIQTCLKRQIPIECLKLSNVVQTLIESLHLNKFERSFLTLECKCLFSITAKALNFFT